jgi:hypothetical protein
MAISEIDLVESRPVEPAREWTNKDRLIWSLVGGLAIYAGFCGFLKFMDYALRS